MSFKSVHLLCSVEYAVSMNVAARVLALNSSRIRGKMTSDNLLYHYCSTQTGFAILESRKIRLSALSAANDSLEGRVLGQVFAELLQTTKLPKGVVDVLSVIVKSYPESTEGFALCLSEKGDLLSQWRAYARDGTGIAIGFLPDVLERDFGNVNFGSQYFELTKVEYGNAGLLESLPPFVKDIEDRFSQYGEFIRLSVGKTQDSAMRALADQETNGEGQFHITGDVSEELLNELMEAVRPLQFQVYNTKPQSFQEECEWRLLRFRHRVALSDVEYFAHETSIRTFISCLIADPAREVIKEVILGPKHSSNISWVRAFLDSVGLPNVNVIRSEIESYR